MRATLSASLQAYLRQRGSTVLTITLKPIRCCGSTVFEVVVDPHAPKYPHRYASFVQDGLCLYYSPQLGRWSDLLELDYVRTLFRSKPVLTGPDDLMAGVFAGHL
jgi:hypothetical protein